MDEPPVKDRSHDRHRCARPIQAPDDPVADAPPRARGDTLSTRHAPLDWVPIPQATLVRALARLGATLADPNASHRDTNTAARTLLAFLKHNRDTLRALIDAQEHEATQCGEGSDSTRTGPRQGRGPRIPRRVSREPPDEIM